MTRDKWAGRKNRESLSKRLGKLARQIKARDRGECVYCGATAENLCLACRACNCARHDVALSTWCRSIGVSARAVRAQARRALPEVA